MRSTIPPLLAPELAKRPYVNMAIRAYHTLQASLDALTDVIDRVDISDSPVSLNTFETLANLQGRIDCDLETFRDLLGYFQQDWEDEGIDGNGQAIERTTKYDET